MQSYQYHSFKGLVSPIRILITFGFDCRTYAIYTQYGGRSGVYADVGAHLKKENLSKIISILTIGVQLGLTFVLTVCIYLVFALLDYEGGFDSFLGLIIFQPMIAILLSVLTILCCIMAGLPIRLNRRLNNWWTRHFFFAIVLTFIGLSLIGASLIPKFMETVITTRDGLEITKEIPNSGLVITGWLLTAFSTLHIYPPKRLTKKVQEIFTNLTGRKIKNAHQHGDV